MRWIFIVSFHASNLTCQESIGVRVQSAILTVHHIQERVVRINIVPKENVEVN
jgi:hypothetical protein